MKVRKNTANKIKFLVFGSAIIFALELFGGIQGMNLMSSDDAIARGFRGGGGRGRSVSRTTVRRGGGYRGVATRTTRRAVVRPAPVRRPAVGRPVVGRPVVRPGVPARGVARRTTRRVVRRHAVASHGYGSGYYYGPAIYTLPPACVATIVDGSTAYICNGVTYVPEYSSSGTAYYPVQ